MDISVMCILIINAKIWTTYLLFVEQCMHLVSRYPFKALSIHVNHNECVFLGHLLLFVCPATK